VPESGLRRRALAVISVALPLLDAANEKISGNKVSTE
jgi:hypothetical protein